MASFTDYNGNTTSFTYDSLGYLTREDNAAAGYLRLEREKTERGFRVTKFESVDGNTSYETSYLTEKLTTGETRQVTSGCCGGPVEVITGTDGGKRIISPDGTITTIGYGPDPRFTMQAPIIRQTTITTPAGLTYEMRGNRTALPLNRDNLFDADSLIDLITINGNTYATVTDLISRKIESISPSGLTVTTGFDSLGRVVRNEVNDILPVNYTYDERGRLSGIRQGEGSDARESGITYNSQGFIANILDALQQSDGYTYDPAGRITNVIPANGLQTGYTYDGNGNITGITPPGKPMHEFEYNPVNLVNTYAPPEVEPGENATHYSYNLNKQLTGIALPDGLGLQFIYNSLGRITGMQLPGGNAVNYSYHDTTNNLIGISNMDADLTWEYDGSLPTVLGLSGAINGNLALTYNNDYRVSSLSVNGGDAVYFAYDADGAINQAGAMTITRYPNGRLNATFLGNIDDSYAYNEFGNHTSYTARFMGGDIFTIECSGIDKLGRITGKSETFEGLSRIWQYTYDAVGQLTDVYEDGVLRSHYEYDGVGNRTGFTGNGGTIAASFDDQDRLLTYGGNSYSYTANGELESKTNGSGTTHYAYDVLGNLKTVTLADGIVIEYVVDGMNRRIGKKVNGALVCGFVYKDQLSPVAQLDETGNLVSTFIYANRINVPDYMVRGGVTYRIITDHLGSPRIVINSESGQIVQRMDFDEFGNVTLNSNPGFQPFGFAGGLYDEQTRLVRFGARDYDAETGRWTCKDPIGFEGEDINLFRYVGNDCINYNDPFGLVAPAVIIFGVGVIISEGILLCDLIRSGDDNRAGKPTDSPVFGEKYNNPTPPPEIRPPERVEDGFNKVDIDIGVPGPSIDNPF